MGNRRNFILGAGTVAFLSPDLARAVAAAGPVASFNVLYPTHAGARFDMAYYRGVHIPLCEKVMKPASTLLIEGVPAGGTPPAYAMIAHFGFSSPEALQAALASPDMAQLRADLPKFTDIKPVILMGRSG